MDLICGFTHEEYRGQGPLPPPGVDLAIVAEAVGLNREAADAYRRISPGAGDADVFTMMLSDALIRMPTTWVAEAHARAGGRTWLYDLTWSGPTLGAYHGIDIPLVFGNATTRPAARFLGSPPPADFMRPVRACPRSLDVLRHHRRPRLAPIHPRTPHHQDLGHTTHRRPLPAGELQAYLAEHHTAVAVRAPLVHTVRDLSGTKRSTSASR